LTRLNKTQLDTKIKFIENYIKAQNAADGSVYDANANVDSKNIATLEADLWKDTNIQVNRHLLYNRITKLFNQELADEYIRQLEIHELYTHDESSLKAYCVSVTMYPFLLDGVTKLGGESKAPKHLASFCGSFINFVFATASQFAGAVATVEFLMYFDYFARKDYGDDYLSTNRQQIQESLQHVIYSLNQPAAARGFQCVREDTTELSTPEGYKKLSELNVGDECYVWKDGKIQVQKINKLNIYDYDDNLIQFKGKNYQQTVTPNHRVLYKIPNTDKYKLKEAKELINHSKLSLPICAEHEDKPDFEIIDDMIILTAAALCDGSFTADSRIRIYTSPNRYGGKYLPEILDRNGIGYSIKDSTVNAFGEIKIITISKYDAQIILKYLKYGKTKLPHWVKLLSSRQAKLFIETWSKFDGSNSLNKKRKISVITKRNHANIFSLQCDNEDIANDLQQVCFIAGLGSKKYQEHHNKFNSKELSDNKTWYIRTFSRKDKRVNEFNIVPYKGKVWCPTTDAGVVVFREENGIPYISGNSVFWNISIYDEEYFNAMFKEFKFPDFEAPSWNSLDRLQRFFMKWFNNERTKAVLTYPVITAACLTENGKMKDKGFEDFISKELSEGNSFFIFMSDNAQALSSCCRLKNDVSDSMNDFSYSLGAGGVATGSINVMTLNCNRLIQDASRKNIDVLEYLEENVHKIHKYQIAFRSLVQEYKDAGMLPVYDAGFISLDKQYLTIGLNGLLEGAEFLEYKISNNDEYLNFIGTFLGKISTLNKEVSKETGFKFNTEIVPAENLGTKNANWDKKDSYVVPRKVYNSYFYKVEDNNVSVLDKFKIHGKKTSEFIDGGSAYHCNLEDYPTQEGFRKLLNIAAKEKCEYFCFNIKITICNDCNNIDKRTHYKCPKCGSKNIDHATRVIGYLKRISAFSTPRQKEAELRHYERVKHKTA